MLHPDHPPLHLALLLPRLLHTARGIRNIWIQRHRDEVTLPSPSQYLDNKYFTFTVVNELIRITQFEYEIWATIQQYNSFMTFLPSILLLIISPYNSTQYTSTREV